MLRPARRWVAVEAFTKGIEVALETFLRDPMNIPLIPSKKLGSSDLCHSRISGSIEESRGGGQQVVIGC